VAPKNSIDTELAAKRLASWLATKMAGANDVTVTDVQVPGAVGMSNTTVLFTASWCGGTVQLSKELVARVQPDGPGSFPNTTYAKRRRCSPHSRRTRRSRCQPFISTTKIRRSSVRRSW